VTILRPPAPSDDPSIPDEAVLLRRIPYSDMVADDSVPSGYRPSSSNFNWDELSAVIASECTLETLLKDHTSYGVASFTVREIRAFGWGVIRVPDPELPGHVHITGHMGKKNQNRQKRAILGKTCRMIRDPLPPT
jgi:hypothetical protein